jgi:hypothetical protein
MNFLIFAALNAKNVPKICFACKNAEFAQKMQKRRALGYIFRSCKDYKNWKING